VILAVEVLALVRCTPVKRWSPTFTDEATGVVAVRNSTTRTFAAFEQQLVLRSGI
jgi:hypothetical protein